MIIITIVYFLKNEQFSLAIDFNRITFKIWFEIWLQNLTLKSITALKG